MILSNERRILTSPESAFHGLESSGEQHTQHICKLRRKSRTTFLSRVELWLLLELLKAFYLGSLRCMTDSIIMADIYPDTTQRLKILFLWMLCVSIVTELFAWVCCCMYLGIDAPSHLAAGFLTDLISVCSASNSLPMSSPSQRYHPMPLGEPAIWNEKEPSQVITKFSFVLLEMVRQKVRNDNLPECGLGPSSQFSQLKIPVLSEVMWDPRGGVLWNAQVT